MNFLELKDISERYIELINPFSTSKALEIGNVLDLNSSDRIIDFGCGNGEWLCLWGGTFGISGVGIELRKHACDRAKRKIQIKGLAERIEIICGDASEFPIPKNEFTIASCVGATFIWGGYLPSICTMKSAIQPGGRLVVGEVYWKRSDMLPEIEEKESVFHEIDLLKMSHEAGFDVQYVVRASQEDWDHYEAENWRGLLAWLDENPDHPERGQVLDHLRKSQDEYFSYGREYFGWAVYILRPIPA
jgi:cyclopropane fatty-acyl-phospholipid synthase-like methyltransferase